jgi:hypothetical protein
MPAHIEKQANRKQVRLSAPSGHGHVANQHGDKKYEELKRVK